MLPMFILIFLIENAHSSYHSRCVKEVPSNEVFLRQSFPVETVQYPLSLSYDIPLPRSQSEFTIGGGVMNDPIKYKQWKFIESKPNIEITTDQKVTENAELVDGNDFVQKGLKDRPRYEWKCPAGFYTIPHNSNVGVSAQGTGGTNPESKLHTEKVPVNHNYFINMQLNKDLSVYGGYGAIVIHSVNLNGFTLTLTLKFDFYHVVFGAKNIPSIQITNNYGPGKIIIQYQYYRWDQGVARDVVYGGNEEDVEITMSHISSPDHERNTRLLPFDLGTNNGKNYAEPQPKSADIEEDFGVNQDYDAMFEDGPTRSGDSSLVFLIGGLVFFVLAIAMVITPFVVPKDNNFELLELYEYYADIDEL